MAEEGRDLIMAIDNKYGRVTLERGSVGEDEPVVVFRAQDALLMDVLQHYRELCVAAGSPERHLVGIDEVLRVVNVWQAENFTQVPQSEVSR